LKIELIWRLADETQGRLTMMKKYFKKEHLIISSFLLLGGIFAFENIKLLDFWLDEAAVYIAIKNSFWDLGKVTADYAQQFLHNFLVKIWTLIFGDSPASIRGFSSFCYLLLIPATYKAGSYFFKDKKIGLLAAYLMTTSYFAIWYSIEAKTYTLAALFGLLSFYFFIKSAREPGKKNYLFYFISSSLGFYAHPWLILIFGSQIMSLLIFRKHFSKIVRLLFVQFLISFSAIPFIILTLSQGKLGINSYAGTVGWSVLFKSFSYLSFGESWAYLAFTLIALFFVMKEKLPLKNIFERIFFGNLPKGECEKKKPMTASQKEELRMNAMLLLYLFVPMFLAAAVSHFTPAYVLGRYEITVLPAFLLILANLWLKIKEKFWLFAIGIVLLCFAFSNIISYRENIESYRSTEKTVMSHIYSEAKSGDYIVTTDLSWATTYYYSSLMKSDKKINLAAYPSQIASQVVWMNREEMDKSENREKYEKEADLIVEKIKNDPNASQIFVMYGSSRPINQMLKNKFDQNFELAEEYYPEAPREPAWYDYVIIYKKPQSK